MSEWSDPQLKQDPERLTGAPGEIKDVTLDHDEGYLHIRLRVEPFEGADDNQSSDEGWNKRDYWVAFDTLDASRGDLCLEPQCRLRSEQGIEFKLMIESPDRVFWMVDRPYDLFGIWHNIREPWQLWSTIENQSGRFNLHRTLTNVPYLYQEVELGGERIQETGRLPVGDMLEGDTRSNCAASSELGVIEVRIPWTLLAFTDPTERRVVDDKGTGRREPDTSITDGIRVWAVHLRENTEGEELSDQDEALSLVEVEVEVEDEVEYRLWVHDTLPSATRSADAILLPEQAFTYRWEAWDTPQWYERRKQTWSALVDLGIEFPDQIIY